eukprot:g2300.t1
MSKVHINPTANSNDEPILVTKHDKVAIIQLNAPPMNLFSLDTVDALEKILPELESDNNVRCIVLRGGPKHFSGGANLRQIQGGAVGKRDWSKFQYRGAPVAPEEAFLRQRMALCNYVEAMRKPTIASIQGACVGGGLELSLCCTFRIASNGCKIGLPEINRGFPPAWGGTVRLVKTVGKPRAMEMALRGRLLDAPEAEKIGLVHFATKPEELEKVTMELAVELSKKAPLAVAGIMEAVINGADQPVLEGVEIEYRAQRKSAGSRDSKEGIKAFFEKREAVFIGK